jgi:dTDP-glucose 4,6-dehydratase
VYDEAKRFAEAMTMAYHRFHGVETRIVRIFNTYGPRMRIKDGRVVPAFISQALRNEPLTVFGDGSQTRSFCFVTDLIDGIYRLLMSDEINPTNIGNPNEMTVLQFAEEIKRLTGSNAPIELKPLPEDDPKIRRPDITKARTLLGWEPHVPLDEGLTKTIDYFRRVL